MKSIIITFLIISFNVFAQEKPNIVFILSDDHAWGDYGFMGNKEVNTPNLDKLASQSLLFKRGYVTTPVCRPSLAAMVTGLHAHQNGVTGNDVVDNLDKAKRKKLDIPVKKNFHQKTSFVKELVKNGYLAHQSGKWWEGSWQDGGFTEGMTRGSRHGDRGLAIARKGNKQIIDFIDSAVKQKKPFFTWYAPYLPHRPHNPPARLLKKHQKLGRSADVAKYYAMIEWLDENIGEVLDHIKSTGQENNTLVVYMADNGWLPRSQADIEVPEGWNFKFGPRTKASPYENGIRTPIMFKLPGKVKAEDSEELASAIDLFPTILSAAGIETSDKLPGVDLLDKKSREAREVIYGAAYAIANMTVGNPADTRQYRWAMTKEWKYLVRDKGQNTTRFSIIHDWDTVPASLYNIENDPGEMSNVIAKHPEVTKELKRKLNNWLSE